MNIVIKYFGVVAEVTGRAEERHDSNAEYVEHLQKEVLDKYPALINVPFRVAKNQSIAEGNDPIVDGDEIALIPPFAGG